MQRKFSVRLPGTGFSHLSSRRCTRSPCCDLTLRGAIMGNENEKNQQNPGQQRNNPGSQDDPNRKNPSQSGENRYKPQDPTSKKPGQDSGTIDRSDREGSEDVEKR